LDGSRCPALRVFGPGGRGIKNDRYLADLSASAASRCICLVSIAVSSRKAYKKIPKRVWSFVSRNLSSILILTWKSGAHIWILSITAGIILQEWKVGDFFVYQADRVIRILAKFEGQEARVASLAHLVACDSELCCCANASQDEQSR
jgi:hypothetical protein